MCIPCVETGWNHGGHEPKRNNNWKADSLKLDSGREPEAVRMHSGGNSIDGKEKTRTYTNSSHVLMYRGEVHAARQEPGIYKMTSLQTNMRRHAAMQTTRHMRAHTHTHTLTLTLKEQHTRHRHRYIEVALYIYKNSYNVGFEPVGGSTRARLRECGPAQRTRLRIGASEHTNRANHQRKWNPQSTGTQKQP